MKVEGMTCGHCEQAVKRIAEGIEGVKVAQVSHAEGLLEVEVSEPAKVKEVIQKINESGIYKAQEYSRS